MANISSRGGLAHFCEHMLFLGTEKYPREDRLTATPETGDPGLLFKLLMALAEIKEKLTEMSPHPFKIYQRVCSGNRV